MPKSKQKFLQIFLSGRESVGELSDRRALTAEKMSLLRSKLSATENLLKGKACVYVTGSFGRAEASAYSDLDLLSSQRRTVRATQMASAQASFAVLMGCASSPILSERRAPSISRNFLGTDAG